jgi:hypothetical protein
MPALDKTSLPKIMVATMPTELIIFAGKPQWTEIGGTQLVYVSNTAGNVFKHLKELKNYVLISGRWFRSESFEGPWEYVSGASQPPDFANIPDNSPKENAKASVPGTHQSQEALIANMIPQTSKVDLQKAQFSAPQYDGAPQLKPIEGTTLQFVVNSSTPIIKVDDRMYYACQNGIWFVTSNLQGPWLVATAIPPVIYSIPVTSPVHYVTNVKVYHYSSGFVWVGYTAGYSGAIVSADGVVVYGTGYKYTPWIGSIYIAAPVTYGYWASPCWTPWAGWSYGFAAGWAWGASYRYWSACPAAPYWGPYGYHCYGSAYNAHGGVTAWGAYGWAGTSGTIYHQSGAWSSASRGAAGYNAATGNQWATQYGRAYNSTTGARAVGQRGAVENVHTGNYAYGERGAVYNPNTGAAAAGGRVTVGNTDSGHSATVGRAAVYNPNTGQTTRVGGVQTENGSVGHVGNDVYASKDGNVYHTDGQGGWNEVTKPKNTTANSARAQFQNQGTTGTSRTFQQPQQANFQNQGSSRREQFAGRQNQTAAPTLQRDAQARQIGEQRTQSFQANRSRPQFNRSQSQAMVVRRR